MEQTVLYHFLTEVPEAAAIWTALLVLALGVLTVLVARPERDGPDEPSADRAAEAATRLADLRRYADEVAVAAAGAAQSSRRRRARWLAAQDDADRAWRAYDEAEAAARRLAGAAALAEPHTSRAPAEYAARERWLHRAAMAAHWQGDLSARQLADVLAGRNGWDPRRHPVEQEFVLARVVRDGRLAHWRAAGERERQAWRDAELAADAARALAVEAYAAAEALRPTPVRSAARATTTPAAVAATTTPAAVAATGARAARFRPARVG